MVTSKAGVFGVAKLWTSSKLDGTPFVLPYMHDKL